MKKFVISCLFFVSLITLVNIPSFRTPEEIAFYLRTEFTYKYTTPDKQQSPEETIRIKSGDCSDFALLVCYLLEKINIKGKFIAIRFKGRAEGHAICVYKNRWGTLSFFENLKLKNTSYKIIDEVIKNYFTDVDYYETIALWVVYSSI